MAHHLVALLLSRLALSVACGDVDNEACRALAEQLPSIDQATATLDAASQLRLVALRPLIEEAAPAAMKVAASDTPVLMKTWGRQHIRPFRGAEQGSAALSTSEEKPLLAKTWGRQHIRAAKNDDATAKLPVKEGCLPPQELAQNDQPVLMKTWGRQHIRSATMKKDTEEG